jgi:hypothetical protein
MVKFMTHATTLSQQHSVFLSLSLFLSASLLSAHPFPFHIKDVSAQEKVPVNKHITTTLVLSSKGCLNTHVLYVYIIISMALSYKKWHYHRTKAPDPPNMAAQGFILS